MRDDLVVPAQDSLLAVLTDDAEFARSMTNIQAAADRIWAAPQHLFYTGHSVEHSRRILEHLAQLTRDCDLNRGEAYVLAAAAFLHDIGMQRIERGKSLHAIRDEHAEIGAAWVENTPDSLGVLGKYADDIARIVRAHRDTELAEPDYHDQHVAPYRLRIALLGALLHLADELELDYRRVDMERLAYQDVPGDSQVHWFRHDYITFVAINPDEGIIRAYWRFPKGCEDDYRSLIADWLQEILSNKLRQLGPYLRSHNVRFELVDPDVQNSHNAKALTPEALVELRTIAEKRRAVRLEELNRRLAREGQRLEAGQEARLQEAHEQQIAGNDDQAARLFEGVAHDLLRQGFDTQAATFYQRAAIQYKAARATRQETNAYLLAAQAHLDVGQSALAVDAARKAVAAAEMSGDTTLRMQAHALLGYTHHARGGVGDAEMASTHYTRARALRLERDAAG